jgi:hypothetical protein
MRRLVAFAPLIVCAATATESTAAPIEPFVSAGIVAPKASPYRAAAQQLGYENGNTKFNFDAELGALFAVAWENRVWVGPALRFDIGRMREPYTGMDPIRTDSASLAMREELQLFRWPKILLWVDESLGFGRIGTSDANKTVPFWGVRFGLALRIGNQRPAARLRFGYAIAPTFSSIAAGGKYDFGGFVFAIDGVLRVGE